MFVPTNKYSVKLEGAAIVGYRTIFIGGIRDPILIGQLDSFLDAVRKRAKGIFPQLASGDASMTFHVYGRERGDGRDGAAEATSCRTRSG